MSKRNRYLVVAGALAALLVGGACQIRRAAAVGTAAPTPVSRPVHIRPDYADTVIPPNIAPLNFLVEEPGTRFRVTISSRQGPAIALHRRSPRIVIPLARWHRLLRANRGQELRFEVSARGRDGRWTRFEPIVNRIAPEPVDRYLVYRSVRPLYNYFRDIGVRQRDLASYRDSVVLHGGSFGDGCLNCHSFCANRPDVMSLALRGGGGGASTLVVRHGAVTKVDAKFGYTAWHPSGRVAAYSINKVRQFFHSAAIETRDVVDLESALAIYSADPPSATTTPELSDPNRLQTYPAWSPDGQYLYFCSAPILWTRRDRVPPEHYEQVRYDLVRVRYDVQTGRWGKLETVLSAAQTGRSILLPRISPDGRFLVFCMCQYGCFPIYQPSSDLYLMDLRTRRYQRLPINSDRSESWHSWSANSRWLAFSSKRHDGVFTRTYFSYIDAAGQAHKPFLLPQRDPTFYDSFLKTYSVPELVTEPVRVTGERLARAARAPAQGKVKDPVSFSQPKPTDAWRSSR